MILGQIPLLSAGLKVFGGKKLCGIMRENVRLRLPSFVAAGLWGFGYFFAGKNLVKMAGFHFGYFEECLGQKSC